MSGQIVMEGAEDYIKSLTHAPELIQKAGEAGVKSAVLEGEAIAKAHVPRVTGQLFSSISGHVLSGGNAGVVGTAIPYGPDVNYGEPAGFIRRYARGRRLPGGGRTRPYVAVSKGRRAKPFIDPTLTEGANLERMQRGFEVAVDRVVAELQK